MNPKYLMWDQISKRDLRTVKNEKRNFHVVLQEFSVTVSKSTPNPTDFTNDNIGKVE